MPLFGVVAARVGAWVCLMVAPLAADVFQLPAGLKSLETLLVDHPGNPPDANGRGAVAYRFRIGRYEVTTSQYVEFLNAKAKADDDGNLWHNDMDSQRSGKGRGVRSDARATRGPSVIPFRPNGRTGRSPM